VQITALIEAYSKCGSRVPASEVQGDKDQGHTGGGSKAGYKAGLRPLISRFGALISDNQILVEYNCYLTLNSISK